MAQIQDAIVSKNTVVSIKYTLTNGKGEILDKSTEEPLEYLQGHGNIIEGLEEALEGKKAGDKFKITIPAEKAYGKVDPEKIFEIDKDDIGKDSDEMRIGMMASLGTEDGMILAHIIDITEDKVIFDANHALAGVDLTFDVEVANIRPATDTEIANGGLHTGCSGNCHSCGGCH